MAIRNKNQEIEDTSIHPQVTQSHPWLVMFDRRENKGQIFFSISKDSYYRRNIPEIGLKRIISNCMEWLVLVDDAEGYLFNLISMEKVKLPKYEELDYCLCCNLTCPPGNPNCHVIFLDFHNNILVCQPGDDKFIRRNIPLPEGEVMLSSSIYFDGSLYMFLHSSLSMIKTDLNDPNFELQTVINGESVQKQLLNSTTRHFLTESCGELLLVSKTRLHGEAYVFHVFRADFSNSEWILLRSIGDRAIFVEQSKQCISCSSSESEIQGNCIYYMEEENRTLYIYNLEDQSSTMRIPCPTIKHINLYPQWVMIPDKCVL